MTPEQILAFAPKVLTQEQREAYFEDGYLLLEKFIDDAWLDRISEVTDQFIEKSRPMTKSSASFDLEDGHSADAPRLRRLTHPVEQHETYRELAFTKLADLAEDLVGPDIKFHHSKLNFKWSHGGEEVKWHQDIQFWPHTNYSPVTIGVYLSDVDDEMGPMGVIPGSHQRELFDLYGRDGAWTGAIDEADLARVKLDEAVWLRGSRGSVTVHNCRMVHGSMPNLSPRPRPLLLQTYASADALHCTNIVDSAPRSNTVIRGRPAKWIHFDPRPCLNPPDWSKGYTSIFAVQQGEDAAD
ncbi:MAG: phytanoyl-CoA dioxygenase family protein [Gammaproteobacteria bacterium]|nr:phytanoyl-CoA dioxygenase family protein [Gammaproteobacteria bacterium]